LGKMLMRLNDLRPEIVKVLKAQAGMY
jgi:hypothetical protein